MYSLSFRALSLVTPERRTDRLQLLTKLCRRRHPSLHPSSAMEVGNESRSASPATNLDQEGHNLAATDIKDIKLLPFCLADTTIWFQRVEVLFRLRQVHNENCKADHMLAALPEDTFPLISGWLAEQGDSLQYQSLKTKILELFIPTPEDRVSRLIHLSKLQIGSQRPSVFFMEMKALTRLPKTDDHKAENLDLLRILWLLRMPPAIRAGITNFMKNPKEDLLKLTDSL